MSSISCSAQNSQCPYYARMTIEHESAELRLKKGIIPQFSLDPLRDTPILYAMLETTDTPKGSSVALAAIKGATFGFLDTLLLRGLNRFKWRQIDPQKLSEISLGKMYRRSLMITGADTALRIASSCAVSAFLGIEHFPLFVKISFQLLSTARQLRRNTTEFVAAKRTLAKFDEMNHLYHHHAAEGTERVGKAGSLDEHRLKSLNEALKVAALQKLMNEPSQTLLGEANQDHIVDLVDIKAATRITSFLAAIDPPAKGRQTRKVELWNGSIKIEGSL